MGLKARRVEREGSAKEKIQLGREPIQNLGRWEICQRILIDGETQQGTNDPSKDAIKATKYQLVVNQPMGTP
jgi:hypothetical protein